MLNNEINLAVQNIADVSWDHTLSCLEDVVRKVEFAISDKSNLHDGATITLLHSLLEESTKNLKKHGVFTTVLD